MSYYRICPLCGSRLDPLGSCGCRRAGDSREMTPAPATPTDALPALMDPVGGEIRSFIIDYRDIDGNYFNSDVSITQPPGACFAPAQISQAIKAFFEPKGYAVYSICENLGGYSIENMKSLAEHDPAEARRHIAVIY